MTPIGIVIHHSETKDGTVKDWDGIKKYHMEEKGWSDIGYHFGIERINGVITTLEGRSLSKAGAHCEGYNNTVGICLVGNYDIAPPDKTLLSALSVLTVNILQLFPTITLSDIHKHSEFAKKTCPGTKFPWYEFMQEVKTLRG